MSAVTLTVSCLFSASLLIVTSGAASASNTNTTMQAGKVNINHSFQCEGAQGNDNTTYQLGRININRTVQSCRGSTRRAAQSSGNDDSRADPVRGRGNARGRDRSGASRG